MGIVDERRRSTSSDYGYCSCCESAHEHDTLMQVSQPWNPLRRPSWQTAIVTALGGTVLFLVNQLTTLLVGFYPSHAKHILHASPLQISLLFSIYPLCIMLACPVASAAANRIGRQSVLCLGLFGSAMATIAFGYATNIYLLVFLRSVQGWGAGMAIVGSVAMLADAFAGNVGHAVSLTELVIAVAFISAPMVGSALYDLGGLQLPFLTSGVAQLVCVMVLPSLFLEYGLPDGLAPATAVSINADDDAGVTDALNRTSIACLAVTAVAMCGFGLIDPNLGSHLQKELGAQHTAVGVGFGLSALVYYGGSVAYSAFSGRCGCKPAIIAGVFVSASGFAVLGLPSLVAAPSAPAAWALWSVQGLALVLIGSGTAVALAPVLPLALASLDTIKPTHGLQLLIGLFGSAVYLGQAIGPFVALGLMQVLPRARTSYCPDGQLCESPLPWVFVVFACFLGAFGLVLGGLLPSEQPVATRALLKKMSSLGMYLPEYGQFVEFDDDENPESFEEDEATPLRYLHSPTSYGTGTAEEVRQGWVCRRSDSNGGRYICGPPQEVFGRS
ncbi:Major Facilitator Superfamily (MFS) [Achlya hypogyna]|uniref:Major Facilitator Superfamily (MFS) n=1 Tax=Achlya hypogyna TaxID=1202772 RepID=A0A1V9Z6L7_ACHHY|nr:Major Facilitator Superfamily (MFS) [Achlya hypogyna]